MKTFEDFRRDLSHVKFCGIRTECHKQKKNMPEI